jgi:drug/metabolite transporter (DMT)-like permease
MNKKALQADSMLLLTSIVWGFAFVAQRVGMDYIGPFAFNGIRFALGSLSLLPLIRFMGKHRQESFRNRDRKTFIFGSLAAGAALFIAASLQQVGIQYTTAGKAGFLTGLYVVLVPIAGIFLGQRTGLPTWIGAVLAVCGMYVLSVPDNLGKMNPGDILVIVGAFFWAVHVLLIDNLSRRIDPIRLASAQFAWCALFSLAAAFIVEPLSFAAIRKSMVPILYGGLVSVGVGYTLQVVAQRNAPPAHSSIIMSLEGVFATIGGILILAEPTGIRNITGSLLMLAGMIATQWDVIFRRTSKG